MLTVYFTLTISPSCASIHASYCTIKRSMLQLGISRDLTIQYYHDTYVPIQYVLGLSQRYMYCDSTLRLFLQIWCSKHIAHYGQNITNTCSFHNWDMSVCVCHSEGECARQHWSAIEEDECVKNCNAAGFFHTQQFPVCIKKSPPAKGHIQPTWQLWEALESTWTRIPVECLTPCRVHALTNESCSEGKWGCNSMCVPNVLYTQCMFDAERQESMRKQVLISQGNTGWKHVGSPFKNMENKL
jgi:hypothetical protein